MQTGTPSAGTYDILDYAGTLTKTADFTISGPQGFNYALNYATAGKVLLNVTPVPEPAAVLLAISARWGWRSCKSVGKADSKVHLPT